MRQVHERRRPEHTPRGLIRRDFADQLGVLEIEDCARRVENVRKVLAGRELRPPCSRAGHDVASCIANCEPPDK